MTKVVLVVLAVLSIGLLFGVSQAIAGLEEGQQSEQRYIFVSNIDLYNASGLVYGSGIWLVKTDAKGNEEWNRTIVRYAFGFYGKCKLVQQTSDGGSIIMGDAYDSGNAEDVLLIKTDASGIEQWNTTFSKTKNSYDCGELLQQTSDGGYAVIATTKSYLGPCPYHILLIKTDANGTEQWNKEFDLFGSYDEQFGKSFQQTSDGGYVIVGNTRHCLDGVIWFDERPSSYYDICLLKTDANGTIEWRNKFGGEYNKYNDCGKLVQQTSDGGYVVVGYTNSYGARPWLIKTDADGKEQWNTTFGEKGYDWSIEELYNNGYVITGEKNVASHYSVWLIKTDSNGAEEWNKTFNEQSVLAPSPPTPTPTPTPETPGFEAIFAIAGLLAIAYLVRQRANQKY